MEGNDPKHIASAIGDVARSKGMTDIANKAGLGRQALYNALSENGNPTFETLIAVLNALGLELSVQKRAASRTSLENGCCSGCYASVQTRRLLFMSTEPRYHINIFWYPDDNCWIADVPDLRPCSAHGDTPERAVAELRQAIELWLETAKAADQPIPEPRYSPAIFAGR